MDNKITKKRLSDFLAYEWVKIILFAIALILVWEFIFTVSNVRLTPGQSFNWFIDSNLRLSDRNGISKILGVDTDKTFSFDILNVGFEELSDEYDTLSLRLTVKEGDAIFTDCTPSESGVSERTERMIADYNVYSLDTLCGDAQMYLNKFYKDGVLDMAEVEESFNQRLSKDNRFRSEEQRAEGIVQEAKRIEKLNAEVKDFAKFLEQTPDEYFYTKEVKQETVRYGLRLGKLKGGVHSVGEYFFLEEGQEDNLLVMIFDWHVIDGKINDLQYETVPFMMTLIREFSDFVA